MSITFILGGARSGKSRRAQSLAEQVSPSRLYLATAEARDEEMTERIRRHRNDRGAGWQTLEEPLELAGALQKHAEPGQVILVDCLTLWLSNLFEAQRSVVNETALLCRTLKAASGDVILVSNEIGLGLVPDNALSRSFRDDQGRLNQAVAEAADVVEFIAAGLPLRLKG
jgi:adenosylcobinamide kinase / adenosylcobinamide-phosphate guanylyltransferase